MNNKAPKNSFFHSIEYMNFRRFSSEYIFFYVMSHLMAYFSNIMCVFSKRTLVFQWQTLSFCLPPAYSVIIAYQNISTAAS